MLEFYKNKKIFITGHTGFKGSWLSKMLLYMGADITGYSLEASQDSLFTLTNLTNKVTNIYGDIRDFNKLSQSICNSNPEIIFHLAAQPLVLESYLNPIYTYETNVMGTINLLESARNCKAVKSIVNITTDKVYKNNEWNWGYREIDALDGFDPYSNSKSCSELVTSCYFNSFFKKQGIAISTARAGNVIGGGDFSKNRIIPDCLRALTGDKKINLRNPESIRPYQHVIDPIYAYLLIACKQYENTILASQYNIGPNDEDCISTGELVKIFCEKSLEKLEIIASGEPNFHEANLLKLDSSKIKKHIGWSPKWNIEIAIEKTLEWINVYQNKGNIDQIMFHQIEDYLKF